MGLKLLLEKVRTLLTDEDGQAIVEWIAVIAFIAVVASLLVNSGVDDLIVNTFKEKIEEVANAGG